MTSNFISTDIGDNVLGNGNSNENNNKNFSTILQNDIDYINTTGYILACDLNLNGNIMYLDEDKQRSISYMYLNLGLLKAVLIKSIEVYMLQIQTV